MDSFNLLADAGADKIITIGDSVFLGSYTNGIDTVKWLNQNTGNKIDSTRPGFWVHPLVNTCYVLTQTVNNYTSSDTVCITVKPLPLKFSSFTTQIQPTPSKEGNVLLQWQTANEINVSHFNTQRSVNGKDFTTIGKTFAKNKSLNEYSFADVLLPSLEGLGVGLFYRIESIDNDGKKQYSETRAMTINNKSGITIYPNPAKDFVNINCVGMKEIKLINQLGQGVFHKTINKSAYKMDVSSLCKGVYFLSVLTTNGVVKNEKLIVQ